MKKLMSRIFMVLLVVFWCILFPIVHFFRELIRAYKNSNYFYTVRYEFNELWALFKRDFARGRIGETEEEKSARIKKAYDDL